MSKKAESTKSIEANQLLGEIRYLEPGDDDPGYADYPLGLLTPILARHISSNEMGPEETPHRHMEFELIVVLKGSITVHLPNSSLHIKTRNAISIKRGVVHSIEPDSTGTTEIELIHFHHGILFGPSINMLMGSNLLGILDDDEYSTVTFDHKTEEGKEVIGRIHDIYKYMHSDIKGSELRAIAAIFDIWSLGISARSEVTHIPLTKQQALDRWRVERATEYIAAHYTEDILLSDISSVCDISESECCRTFQRALHSSPIDYINRYRIYAAAEILTNDTRNTPMSEIALMVGFNYASYFNKTFKRYIGMTPMQYRKQFNKAELYRKNQHEFRI